MSGILIKFALALVLLWTCGPAAVRPTLVAYYSFDGAAYSLPLLPRFLAPRLTFPRDVGASVGIVEGLSGYCPNVVSRT
jgi:hypothetical protein